ncbi:unnamed protein product [Amaranthus hypochondriacus]
MHYKTHLALTYEFLSSFELRYNDEGVKTKFYRLNNSNFATTVDELAVYIGIVNEGSDDSPSESDIGSVWTAITGEIQFALKNLRTNRIHHPSVRILFKFLANTLFARSEGNKVNSNDLGTLGSYIFPQSLPKLNYVHFLLTTFETPTLRKNLKVSTAINFGGLITHLAGHLNKRVAPTTRPDLTTIDITHLKHSTYVRILDEQSFDWVTKGKPSIRLLGHPLPPLVPEVAKYLIDFQLQPRPRNPLPREPQTHNNPSTYSPTTPAGYDTIPQSLERLHTGIQQNQQENLMLNERLARMDYEHSRRDLEHQRAQYPIYDYHYRQSHFDQQFPHPGWYTPNPDISIPSTFTPYGFPDGMVNSFTLGGFDTYYAGTLQPPPQGGTGNMRGFSEFAGHNTTGFGEFSTHPNTSAPSGSGHGTSYRGKEVMSVDEDDIVDDDDNVYDDDNDEDDDDDDDGGDDDPSWMGNY